MSSPVPGSSLVLHLLFSAYNKNARATALRFIKITTNVYGLDKALRIIVYTLSLASALRLRVEPSSTIAPRIKALSSALADTRIAMRLFSTIPSIEYFLDPVCNPTTRQRFANAALLVYAPAELAYWLGAHSVVPMTPLTLDRWSRLSCIGWGAWIVVELYEITLAISAKREQLQAARVNAASSADVKAALAERDAVAAQLNDLYARAIAQMCDLPMAVHWSLPSYPLPGELVSALGIVGGVAGWWRMWRNAA
ncbi:peroxisomal biogenesis factor 11 [Blastocladiella britannica]|nr:peroxisomal biogenesis factor 11 [Blastocladiella britannica]